MDAMIAKQPVRMIAKAHVNTIAMIPVQVALVVEDVPIAHLHVVVLLQALHVRLVQMIALLLAKTNAKPCVLKHV